MDYTALRAKWPSVSGATAQNKLDALNAETVAGPRQDVGIADVQTYLGLRGLLVAIEDWIDTSPAPSAARIAAKELMRTINTVRQQTFQMSDVATYAAIQGMLGSLAVDPPALITTQHVADLLAMAETKVPWHAANGYANTLNVNDLTAAGLS